ncbi:MAG TPA: glucosaminidase domain-containing protein [Ferruginibacter sp.]|nr:glucosaminidase domain-containing protein [Bacteroidota bacterium]MBS1926680.1 glucosaminidase domain-containing protein [Bacteroidota bacterium]HMT95138.1 glucosaminidase domain-containing protein [Ferruginibacter sp.]HMU24633.1 glucosaminidase domain-containing protein [Ferruginibacter sp.]
MKKLVTGILFCLMYYISTGQTPQQQAYIETYKDLAVKEMKRSGIPASITLAQGLLETEAGTSDLVKRSNNHFGIKCKSTWTGPSVSHTDDAPNECFRKYATAEESYSDHSNFLRGSDRYSFLFELPANDYKGWAYGLKKAGYATNPNYPKILIKYIEANNLQQYDDVDIIPGDIAKTTPEAVPEIKPEAKAEKKSPIAKVVDVVEKIVKPNPVVPKNPKLIAGKSKVNGIKALFAQKGTSLLAIATANDIPLVKLLEYNDRKTDGLLSEDQVVYLDKKMKQGNKHFYYSLQDETLYQVSQNFGIQLQYLVQYNNLSETAKIKKGQKIWLKPDPNSELTKSK